MENVKNVSSEEELLKLRNEGRITRAEYEELLSEIQKTPGKLPQTQMFSSLIKNQGIGIKSFILSIAGILLPLLCSAFIYFVLKNDSDTPIVMLFFLAIAIEIISLIFGIVSCKTTFGKAGIVISSIIIILLVLYICVQR